MTKMSLQRNGGKNYLFNNWDQINWVAKWEKNETTPNLNHPQKSI